MDQTIPQVIDGDWPRLRQIINRLKLSTGVHSTPTFAGLTLTDLTAERLVATDSLKALESTDVASWVLEGSANQVIVTDEGDGTVTLKVMVQ
jgi:hypothetical protein